MIGSEITFDFDDPSAPDLLPAAVRGRTADGSLPSPPRRFVYSLGVWRLPWPGLH